jgi:hypothetical protein
LRIAEFWEKNCPQYYEVGVREVAEVDLNDKTKFYFGRYKFNLKYSGINVDYVLHFLMQNDTKRMGNSSPFKTYGSTEMPYCGGRKWLTNGCPRQDRA